MAAVEARAPSRRRRRRILLMTLIVSVNHTTWFASYTQSFAGLYSCRSGWFKGCSSLSLLSLLSMCTGPYRPCRHRRSDLGAPAGVFGSRGGVRIHALSRLPLSADTVFTELNVLGTAALHARALRVATPSVTLHSEAAHTYPDKTAMSTHLPRRLHYCVALQVSVRSRLPRRAGRLAG